MLNVTVVRRRWLRGGRGKTASYLLSPTSKRMCCMGFACRAAGLKAKVINGVEYPDHLDVLPNSLRAMTDNQYDLAQVNDSAPNDEIPDLWKGKITPAKREAAIKKLGKKVGINFRFVD